MKEHKYFSVEPKGSSSSFFYVHEMISTSVKVVKVKREAASSKYQVQALTQVLENGPTEDTFAAVSDPSVVDILRIAEFNALQNLLFEWDASPLEQGHLLKLQNKRKAEPHLGSRGLLSIEAPEVLVLQALLSLGWSSSGKKEIESHRKDGAKTLYWRKGDGKHYYQCLLIIDQLFDRGLQLLPTRDLVSYYRAVIEAYHIPGASLPVPGLSASLYKELVKAIQDEKPLACNLTCAFSVCVSFSCRVIFA